MAKDLYICALLDFYGAFLSEKQRALAEHYYNEDLSLGEIAENEGITRQGVRDLIKRAETQLKKFEDECGYCKKVLSLQEIIEGDAAESQKLFEISKIIDNF